jgi:sugar lactone lactonase YvrE
MNKCVSFLPGLLKKLLKIKLLLLIVIMTAGSGLQAQLVSSLAGRGSAENGPGLTATFKSPNGIVVDSKGNLYVADYENNIIRKISPTGEVSNFAGSGLYGKTDGEGVNARFNTPQGLAIDSDDNIYVSDNQNCSIRKITSAGVVSTVAGGTCGYASDGPAAEAIFYGPQGMAIDAGKNIYVADANNHKIRKISTEGIVTTLAGSGNAGSADGVGAEAGFNYPNSLFAAADGNIYVTDAGNNKIRKISPEGVVTTVAGSGTAGNTDGTGTSASFSYPGGIVGDASGNLFVADCGNHVIRKITRTGEVTTFAGDGSFSSYEGTGINAGILDPTGIALSASGDFYVTSQFDGRILKVTSSAVVTIVAGSDSYGKNDGSAAIARFTKPAALTVDLSGSIYVADYGNNVIRKISAAGVVSTFAGSGGLGDTDGPGNTAKFRRPKGVATDAAGNVYVADEGNNKIRKISPDGLVSTLAGNGTAGSADGQGTAAGFEWPSGVAVDSSGNVYVAERYKIRKVTPDGVVSTIAGSGTSGNKDGTGDAASFSFPAGIAVDATGVLYVADTQNYNVRKITKDGVVSTYAGTGKLGKADGLSKEAGFFQPKGVAVDKKGNVYVADDINNKIRKISTDGIVSTYVGIGTTGSVDGPGSLAAFRRPAGVAIDAGGNLYVAEEDNNKIRKITPLAEQTITGLTDLTRGAGETITLNAVASSGLPVTYASSNPSIAWVTGNSVKLNSSGTVTIVATQTGNEIYSSVTVTVKITVTKSPQTITGLSDLSKTRADVPFGLSAKTSSNLPVTYTSSNPEVATISGSLLTITGVGTTTITASQAGNNAYLPAEISVTLTVTKAGQTITGLKDLSKSTVDVPFELKAVSSSGLPVFYTSSDTSVAKIAGKIVTVKRTGSAKITATQPGDSIYSPATPVFITITVTRAPQTISGLNNLNKTATDADFDLNGKASSGLKVTYTSSDTTVAKITGKTVKLKGAGIATIIAEQAGDSSYAPVTFTVTLKVTKASQTISGLNNLNKKATDPDFDLPGTASSGLKLTYTSSDTSVATINGNTVQLKGGGIATIITKQAGDNVYTPAESAITLTVAKASQSITGMGNQRKRIDEGSFELKGIASSGLEVAYTSSDTAIATISGNIVTIKKTGTAKITASQPGNSKYEAAEDATMTLLVISQTSVYDSFQSQYNVYDNGKHEIEIQGEHDGLEVTDLNGRVYYRGKNSVISVAPDQLYFVIISKGEYQTAFKVLVR